MHTNALHWLYMIGFSIDKNNLQNKLPNYSNVISQCADSHYYVLQMQFHSLGLFFQSRF